MSKQDLFDLSGKVALITGASRGIGESIARTLANYGAHVIVSSRKIDGCEAVASSIREAGGSAEAYACHIGEMDQIEDIWQHIESKHGKLDVLVNNAAANPYFGPIEDTDLGAYHKTVDVNIRGYFFMCARGAQIMKKNGGGSIINVASVNGVNPFPGYLFRHQSSGDIHDKVLRHGTGAAEGSGKRPAAGADRHQVRQCADQQRSHQEAGDGPHPHEAGGRPGRNGRHGPLPGVGCFQLYHRHLH